MVLLLFKGTEHVVERRGATCSLQRCTRRRLDARARAVAEVVRDSRIHNGWLGDRVQRASQSTDDSSDTWLLTRTRVCAKTCESQRSLSLLLLDPVRFTLMAWCLHDS